MDDAPKTFAFIEDVKNSEFSNGLLPITTASGAKQLLKRQIADFVGEKLSDTARPVRTDVQEVLAELRTLRMEIVPTDRGGGEARKYLRAMRFLLNDRRENFRKFCTTTADGIDSAVNLLIEIPDLDSYLKKLGIPLEIEDNLESFRTTLANMPTTNLRSRYAWEGTPGWWGVVSNQNGKTATMSTSMKQSFQGNYTTVQRDIVMP